MFDLPRLWRYPRAILSDALAKRLLAQERIAFYGPRQTGKTSLLREEVSPAIEARGGLVIYADCWADRADPLAGINYALQKALDDLTIPKKGIGRSLASPVKKVGVGGATLELADLPTRRIPSSPYLLFDALLTTLLRETSKKIVLIVDEFQAIADATDGDAIAAAMRAALTQASGRVGVLFSGSSDVKLLQLFSRAKAPMYGYATTTIYPLLDGLFVEHVANQFRAATRRAFDVKAATEQFTRFGCQPESFLAVVSYLLANPKWSFAEAEAAMLDRSAVNKWSAQWHALTPLQQGVLVVLANDASPGTRIGLNQISTLTGQRVVGSSVSRALSALTNSALIEKTVAGARAPYVVLDPVMREWVRRNYQLPKAG
ncbi:MAG: hypothetical protein ACKO15_01435 [Burkholderiales bacterium]